MGTEESFVYAPVEYRLSDRRAQAEKTRTRIIEKAAGEFQETASANNIRLNIQNTYEVSSLYGVVSQRLIGVTMKEPTTERLCATIEVFDEEERHAGIRFAMTAKPKLPEEAYAALEKVLYDHAHR
jgi:hypothetical protein